MTFESETPFQLSPRLLGKRALPHKTLSLRANEAVEVRSATEIFLTLDEEGTLDGLPFMPEMLPYCGRRFRIFRRAEKTCIDIHGVEVREFRNNDVVILESLRCSGLDHGGCQRNCMLFWKAAWLRPVYENVPPLESFPGRSEVVPPKLKASLGPDRFFCQSSELVQATRTLYRGRRAWKCVRDVWMGTYGILHAVRLVVVPLWQKLYIILFDDRYRGDLKKTPAEALGLQPGERVQVKSLKEIIETLDHKGKNRGLFFSPDMRAFCGKTYRVRNRLDKMIMEGTGRLREVHNTVILEGVNCRCPTIVGGCPRRELLYWREIWLRRV